MGILFILVLVILLDIYFSQKAEVQKIETRNGNRQWLRQKRTLAALNATMRELEETRVIMRNLMWDNERLSDEVENLRMLSMAVTEAAEDQPAREPSEDIR
ncbi:hypothetical protein N0V90_003559, partial [Kalmusia sp. IMI 367209]